MKTEVLVAGRELDALVAERVMGWGWVKHRMDVNSAAPGQRYLCEISEEGRRGFFERFCDYAMPDDPICEEAKPYVPSYSTDRTAAWTVVEHWKGDFELRRQNEHFRATFFKPSYEYSEWADTAPLAIVLAALKAVGA
jgi:hypothetical protein